VSVADEGVSVPAVAPPDIGRMTRSSCDKRTRRLRHPSHLAALSCVGSRRLGVCTARRLGGSTGAHQQYCCLSVRRMLAATVAPAWVSRTASVTSAPRSASTRAVTAPMADEKPLTIARLPDRSMPAATWSGVERTGEPVIRIARRSVARAAGCLDASNRHRASVSGRASARLKLGLSVAFPTGASRACRINKE
jgi:hypothetical protein